MSALSIAEANVAWVSGPFLDDQVAGEAFSAGANIAYDPSLRQWFKAACNATAVKAGESNLALALASASAAGARLSVASPGAIVAVGAGTAGIVYHPGTTAGTLIPTDDLASGNKATIAALGIGNNRLLVARVYHANAIATGSTASALTITPSAVTYISGPIIPGQVAGEAFSAGAMIAYDLASRSWFKADANATSVLAGEVALCMALASAPAPGARFTVARPGAIVSIGTGQAGAVYAVGGTAGQLVPAGALNEGDVVSIAALGIGSNQLLLARICDAGAVVGPKPLLLDSLAGAPVAAYATWKLRLAYAGACLRVRRSSDSTEQDIGFSGNNLDTAALLAFAGAGDAFVTKFYSQGTTASRDIVQATAARQPKIVSAGALTITSNGTPGMLFDGVNDALGVAFTLNQPSSRVMVARQVSHSSGSRLWDGASVNQAGLWQNPPSPNVVMFAGSSITLTGMTIGADHVVTEQFNGASSKGAIDNGSYVTGNAGAANATGLTIGASDTNGSSPSNIAFYGGLIFGAIASDPDIALCRTKLGASVGLSL